MRTISLEEFRIPLILGAIAGFAVATAILGRMATQPPPATHQPEDWDEVLGI